eukprot:2869200-Pyramimonas_sp.AAC.1
MMPRSAVLGLADAYGQSGPTGAFGGAPIWGRETLYWVWRTHAGTAAGAFGGAHDGAMEHCTGCGGRMQAPPLGPS